MRTRKMWTLGTVIAVVAVGAFLVVRVLGAHSESWQAGRDYSERLVASAESKYSGALLEQAIQGYIGLCDNVYLLADAEAGGQAYNDGEAAYDRADWIAGCESVSEGKTAKADSGEAPRAAPEQTSTSHPTSDPTYEESVTAAGDQLDRIKQAMDYVIAASAPEYNYIDREYLPLLDETWATGQEFGKAVLRHSDSKVIESYRECEVGKNGYFEKNPSPNHSIPSDLDGNFLVACRAEIWEAGRGDKPPTQFEPAPDIDY